jgi:transcriptional regulator with GAF, ATPase, and Fis domain
MENERQLIITALRQTSGKIQGKGGAAELLGINHNTLKSRMRKFGIARDQVMG